MTAAAPERDITAAIAAQDISKDFGHIRALANVSVSVAHGEIVALFGDNGAGKSTLMEIMSGSLTQDTGDLYVNGQLIRPGWIQGLDAAGVSTVHQDLALAPDLPVYENLFLGREITYHSVFGRMGLMSRKAMKKRAAEVIDTVGLRLASLDEPVRSLSGGQAQALAIAKAVAFTSTALLLDEPTAALGTGRADLVTDLILRTAARGVGILVISHDLPRILAIAHRVIILWHGEVALESAAGGLSVQDVIRFMVGGGHQ